MLDVSVVIPIKDEQDNIRELCQRIRESLESDGSSFELVIVDDGSRDGSFEIARELANEDYRIKVVRLNKNYGQTPATRAGIDWSSGAAVVTMDGDLQNDPNDIPVLLNKLNEGYDVVLGYRLDRKDGLFMRKIPSWIANWLIRRVTGTSIRDLGCAIRAMRREVAQELPLYGELHRFIPILAQHSGARMTQIPVRHHPRVSGKTKYNLSRTFRVVLDLITVKFLNGYVTRPMHAFGLTGLATIFLGLLTFGVSAVMKLQSGMTFSGNPLFLGSVVFFLMGVQFISMGLLGEMLTRTYFSEKGRATYHVRTTINVDSPMDHKKAA